MRNNKKRGTLRLAVLGVLSLLALFALAAGQSTPARAADATVSVGSSTSPQNVFTPATANISVGDKVNFTRVAGTHDATSNTGLFAISISSGSPTGSTPVFATAGTYYYYCTIHYGGATDNATLAANLSPSQMVGRIIVAAPVADTTPPTVSGVAATPNPTAGSGAVTLTATINDTAPVGATPSVAGAEWSKGVAAATAGTGAAMTATDLSFNSANEGVTGNVPISEAAGASVTLWVRGRDAAGNWSTTAVSTVVSVTGPPAGAVQASVTVTGGNLGNQAQAISFPGVTLNGLDQTVAGTTAPAWVAQDARGSGLGWNVTITSTNFTGSGGSIPVANFKVQLLAVTTLSGNTAPTPSPGSYTALGSTPLKLLSATGPAGMGSYEYTPQFQLTVPGSAAVGSYTANVTVSVNSGP